MKKKKNENDPRILDIQISLDSKFQLQQPIFKNKFPRKKDTSGPKQKKMNITIELLFKFVRVPIISLNWQF